MTLRYQAAKRSRRHAHVPYEEILSNRMRQQREQRHGQRHRRHKAAHARSCDANVTMVTIMRDPTMWLTRLLARFPQLSVFKFFSPLRHVPAPRPRPGELASWLARAPPL